MPNETHEVRESDRSLAQRVVQRYATSPGVVVSDVSTSLAQRASERGLGHLPVVSDVLGRWTFETSNFTHRLPLVFARPARPAHSAGATQAAAIPARGLEERAKPAVVSIDRAAVVARKPSPTSAAVVAEETDRLDAVGSSSSVAAVAQQLQDVPAAVPTETPTPRLLRRWIAGSPTELSQGVSLRSWRAPRASAGASDEYAASPTPSGSPLVSASSAGPLRTERRPNQAIVARRLDASSSNVDAQGAVPADAPPIPPEWPSAAAKPSTSVVRGLSADHSGAAHAVRAATISEQPTMSLRVLARSVDRGTIAASAVEEHARDFPLIPAQSHRWARVDQALHPTVEPTLILRQAASSGAAESLPTATAPPPATAHAAVPSQPTGGAAPPRPLDIAQITDAIGRMMARELEVERERRGLGRWH